MLWPALIGVYLLALLPVYGLVISIADDDYAGAFIMVIVILIATTALIALTQGI